jgi:hypothetical protein
MRFVPKIPPPGNGLFRGWRALILLFAGLLTIGVLQPVTASAGAPALLRVQDKTVVETDSGTKDAYVKIVLSKRVHKKVSVAYATKDGTAKADSDYVARSGRAYFPKGAKKAYVRIPVIGDKAEENEQFFKVRIHDAYGAKIAKRVAYVRILDDDEAPKPPPEPKLAVSDTKVHEGAKAYFKVSLSEPAKETVTFDYETDDGSAEAYKDYDRAVGINKRIPIGEDHTWVAVQTREDDLFEGHETFSLDVEDVHNAEVVDARGRALILDDDPPPPPKLSVRGDRVHEGDAAWFKVTLSKPAWREVSFDFATRAGTATANVDYDTTTGRAHIPRGQDSVRVKVMTRQDSIFEPGADETFFLDVSDVHGAQVLDGTGTAFIVDDEKPPLVLSVQNAQPVDEGAKAVFRIQLSAPAPHDVLFDFTTQDGTGPDGASSPQDYDAKAQKDVVIQKNSDHVRIEVQTRNDSSDENDETFFLKVSQVRGAQPVKDSGTGTIKDVYPWPAP